MSAEGGRKRGRKPSRRWAGKDEALRSAVRVFCLAEYTKLRKKRWKPAFGGTRGANVLERDARKIFRELHEVAAKIRALAERAREPLSSGNALAWLCGHALPLARNWTLAHHPSDAFDTVHPLHDEERVNLIILWETYVVDGGGRLRSGRQAAVVSLLSGIWPNLHPSKQYTAADVVREEEKRIRPLLDRHNRRATLARTNEALRRHKSPNGDD